MVRMSAAPWGRAMLQISVEQALVVDQGMVDQGMKVATSGRPYVAAGQRFGRVGTQQLFSRWDGFTLTFPEPEVFGL